ncbi:MAG: AAA family ATPase [Desulfomonile tiedjei]|nr:AAA family ATPase [Desulfomonile tiedjei]
MRTREQLDEAVAALNAQRSVLGDDATDAALAAVRQELAALDSSAAGTPQEEGQLRPAERRLVTVMFADISGFTSLSENLDPETVRDLMNACFGRLVPVIAKYEGTVDKFIGDEIMAVFGAPRTHENDPERAIASALEMMDVLAEFNAERGLDLGMHFGINTGPVIAGSVGSDDRQDYSVMGDAVNLASRLEDRSERGEILVGPDTYRSAEKYFRFQALPKVRVKGKAEPVQVYRVLGFREAADRMESPFSSRFAATLIGRDDAFAAVYQRMERLTDGTGGIVGIVGEAGLGKSRLVAEVRDRALHDSGLASLQWLEGHTVSFGQAIGYRPFQEILWQFAGITETCEAAEAWRRLAAKVKAFFGDEAEAVLPYLARLVSLDPPETFADRVRFLDGEAMRRQIFLASRRFFEACAQARPVVLVFEDLQWVDDSSALLLEHLLPLAGRLPILILCVSRPDPGTPAERVRRIAQQDYPSWYTEVTLSPLSQKQSAQLVQDLLRTETVPPKIKETILSKAEGNPFFLEEIVRSLIDNGKRPGDAPTGRWQSPDLAAVSIPDTIQGVIMARVDRLDRDLRQVLSTASVIGRSFFYQVLRSVQDADRKLDQHLADLQHLEFIQEKPGHADLEYMFKHAIAQQAMYESILLKKRRGIHARVAQTLETVFADRLEEMYSLLADHYARAEIWDKAQHYLRLAGDHAGRMAADTEALASYRQAIEAYQKAFGDQWDPFERASLHRKIGEALFRRGEHSAALEYLNLALGYLGRPVPTGVWKTRLMIAREIVTQVAHRFFPRLFCAPMRKYVAPDVEEEFRLYEVIGWIDAFEDYEHFFLIALKGLNVSERTGYASGAAKGLMALGTIADIGSLFRVARWYHQRAKRVAEEIQHPAAQGAAHMGLALHHLCVAKWDIAINHARRSAQIYREIGDLRGLGCSLYMAAVAMAYQGNFADALLHCAEIIALGDNGADLQVRCWGLATEGFVLRLMGRFEEAASLLRQAIDIAEAIQDHVILIWSTSELGRCRLRQDRLDEAAAAMSLSRDLIARHGHLRLIWVPSRNAQCEWALAASEQACEADRAGSLRLARRACTEALSNAKTYEALLPEAARLKGVCEFLKGNATRARKWWHRSAKLAEASGQRHDLTATLMEMEQRLAHRSPTKPSDAHERLDRDTESLSNE